MSFTPWFSERWPPRTPSEKATRIMVSMPAMPSGMLAKLSRPGVTRAKFPLDTFVKQHWPRTRSPGKFALSESHAPGKAGLARLVPKNHGSPGDRVS